MLSNLNPFSYIARAQRPSAGMGQGSSTLKETRTTDENDQLPTGKNRLSKKMKLSKEVMPQTAECAASSSGTIENADLSLRETFRKVLHINRPRAVYAPNALLNLPTELILGIAKDLSPSNYMSLSYSCRTIRKKMGASRAHVLGNEVPKGQPPGSTLSAELRNIRYLERWELRRMLDRDEKTLLSTAFRRGHKKTGDCSTSSVQRLPRLTTKHRSSGSAGLVWICPHRIHNFVKALRPFGDRNLIKCGGSTSTDSVWYFPWVKDYAYVKHRPIMRVSRNRAPSNEEVKEALSSLTAPVCPHLRLNDACVASAYAQDCLSLCCRWKSHGRGHSIASEWSTWYSESPPTIAICNFCDVTIQFSKYENFRGLGETLDLAVVRRLWGIWSPTDRAWICHVADPADFKEYEEAWKATDAECWRRISQY